MDHGEVDSVTDTTQAQYPGQRGGKRRRRKNRRHKQNPMYIPKPVGPTQPGAGVLDVQPDGSGFLRFYQNNYLAGANDFYVPPGLVRMHGLRGGSYVEGQIG